MNFLQKVITDSELGISPYIKKKNKPYNLVKTINSLGEEFAFVCDLDWFDSRKERVEQAIERVKYPLTEGEQSTLLSHILVVAAAKKRKALTYAEYDKILKSLGVYYRLGVMNLSELERKQIVSDYCFIYQLKVITNRFTYEDIEQICAYAAQGLSIKEIMSVVPHFDYKDIYRLLKKNRLLNPKRNKQTWSDEDRQLLKEHLDNGSSYKYLAEKVFKTRSEGSIRAYASLIGFKKGN